MFRHIQSADRNISIKLANDIAEIGEAFHLTVERSPTDGVTNDSGRGKIREVRVHLEYATQGRGTTNSATFPAATFPVDQFGMGSGDIVLPIPIHSPVSYDGRLLRVVYQIVVTTDVQAGMDHNTEIPVAVVLENGGDTYRAPHPLRTT